MFDQSMGEAVVGVFFYIGMASAAFLCGTVGIILLGDDFKRILKFGKGSS